MRTAEHWDVLRKKMRREKFDFRLGLHNEKEVFLFPSAHGSVGESGNFPFALIESFKGNGKQAVQGYFLCVLFPLNTKYGRNRPESGIRFASFYISNGKKEC